MSPVTRPVMALISTAVAIGGAALGVQIAERLPLLETAAPPPAASTAADAPAGAEPGKAVFDANCASCHGAGGAGGYAPALTGLHVDAARIAAIVRNGAPPKMPAFSSMLKPNEVDAVSRYVVSLRRPRHGHPGATMK